MDSDKSITATFTLAPVAKNITKPKTYDSLVTALSEATSGDEINMLDTTLKGAFTLATGVVLRGGYDTSNVKVNNPTTLNGSFIVTNGASTIETVVVKGKLIVRGGILRVKDVKVQP